MLAFSRHAFLKISLFALCILVVFSAVFGMRRALAAPFDCTPDTPEVPGDCQELETMPEPPPAKYCSDENFVRMGVARVSTPDSMRTQINCRMLVINRRYPRWNFGPLYGPENIGNQGVVNMGIQQAMDIFSPSGLTYFQGGIVVCLRGNGRMIWMAASQAPRVPQIVDTYTAPDVPRSRCLNIYEPGMLVLVDGERTPRR